MSKKWNLKTINELADIYNTSRQPLNSLTRENMKGCYPYCGANGVVDYINDYKFDGEYVLIAEDGGYWGECENSSYIMRGKFWVNNHAHIVKAKPNIADNYFLCYLLNFLNMEPFITGDARGKLSKSIFVKIKLPCPPLPEQKKIAKTLSTIQRAIETQDKIIANVQELKKATMEKIFTKGLNGEKTKQTEIGEMPEGWEVVRLGKIANTSSGGTPSRKNPKFYEGNIPWVKSGELNDCDISNTKESITEDAIKKSSAKIYHSGTLLIALYGATTGKTAILRIKASTNQAVCAISPKSKSLSVEGFIQNYLIHFRHNILKERYGGAQPNISQTILRRFKLPVPPFYEQKKIAEILQSINRKIEQHEAKKTTLQDFFKTVLDKLMKGENIK